MDIDRVLHHFTMSLWRTFGALICFGCVEDVEKIEDFIVFEVLSVCDVFFDGVITFSLVGLACSYLQTRWTVSTELKTRLATLAYDFCFGQSFAAETNLSASVYIIFFSDFAFCISFSVLKKWQSLEETIWGWPQLQHMMSLVQSKPWWSSSPHLNMSVSLCIGLYHVRIFDTESIALDLGNMDLLVHCKDTCEWIWE